MTPAFQMSPSDGTRTLQQPVTVDQGEACRFADTRGFQSAARLELLFGTRLPGARAVGETEWDEFVDSEIAPRFPGGFTIITGEGRWRNSRGSLVKDVTKIVLVWYPTGSPIEQHIECIRNAYKERFKLESVLRVDAYSLISF